MCGSYRIIRLMLLIILVARQTNFITTQIMEHFPNILVFMCFLSLIAALQNFAKRSLSFDHMWTILKNKKQDIKGLNHMSEYETDSPADNYRHLLIHMILCLCKYLTGCSMLFQENVYYFMYHNATYWISHAYLRKYEKLLHSPQQKLLR